MVKKRANRKKTKRTTMSQTIAPTIIDHASFTSGFWRTRTGRKARILAVDVPGDQPMMGYIENPKGKPTPTTWDRTGKALVGGNDLVEIWVDTRSVTIDLYVGLDHNGAAVVSYTPPHASDKFLGCQRISVTVKEGDAIEGTGTTKTG